MLRGVQTTRGGGGADVAAAVVARPAATAERVQDDAASVRQRQRQAAADAGPGGGTAGQGEKEEKVPGEKERTESSQDVVGHTADVHHHVDAVQHSGAAKAVHGHGHEWWRR